MTTSTSVRITCDICYLEITEKPGHVSASVYGLDFHRGCLERVNGTIIGLLVDDIEQSGMRLYWDKKGSGA